MSHFKSLAIELECLMDNCKAWYEVNNAKSICFKFKLNNLLDTIEDMNQLEYSDFLAKF